LLKKGQKIVLMSDSGVLPCPIARCCDVPVGRQVQHKKRNSLDGYKNPADIPITAISGSPVRGVQLTLIFLLNRVTEE
jgi:hypothetical protein